MKKLIYLVSLAITYTLLAQIVALHPVKVPDAQINHFENIELNYSKEIAQHAVNNGDLEFWALMKAFNPGANDYKYLWFNVYKDIEHAVGQAPWWNHAQAVLGVETSILYEGFSDLKTDRRYYYAMNQEIAATAPAQYVIFNFSSPENLNLILEQTKNIVIPHFKKNMAASGMIGWGLGLKVTPQGTDYAIMMTYDAYDNLENVMKHLSGGTSISGLLQNKLEPIQWSMRPVMRVMGATTPNPKYKF